MDFEDLFWEKLEGRTYGDKAEYQRNVTSAMNSIMDDLVDVWRYVSNPKEKDLKYHAIRILEDE